MKDPAKFLGAATEVVAMDALSVQLECARVGLVQEAEDRGVVDQPPHCRPRTG